MTTHVQASERLGESCTIMITEARHYLSDISCLLFTATAAMHRILPWHASHLHVRGTRTTRYRTGTMYLYPRDGYMYPNICTRVLAVNLEYRI